MSETHVHTCDCKSVQQDLLYGPGMRVHNAGGKQLGSVTKKPPTWHCTVCGKETPRSE